METGNLTLTRKAGERILIGTDVVVEVVAIKPHSAGVKLRISAPRDVPILREELAGSEPRPVAWNRTLQKE